MPWKCAFNTYVRGRRGEGTGAVCQNCRESGSRERVAVAG